MPEFVLAASLRLTPRGLLARFRIDIVIAAVTVCLLGGVWAIATNAAIQNERRAIEDAYALTRNETALVTLQWAETLTQIKLIQYIARQITVAVLDHDPSAPALQESLRENLRFSGSWIPQVGAANPEGYAIWSTLGLRTPPVNFAGREQFVAIMRDGHDSFLGRPAHGLVSGVRSIFFSEAVRGSDHAARALTTVSVATTVFKPSDRITITQNTHTIICIIRTDGVILASTVNARVDTTLEADDLRELTGLLKGGAVEASGTDMIDGVRHYYAWRRLDGTDVLVWVRLGKAELLAPMRRANSQNRFWAVLLGTALSCLGIATASGVRYSRSVALQKDSIRAAAVARKMAHAERLAALGETTTHIAHEINQPLSVIAMAAENGLMMIESGRASTDQIAAKFRRISAHAHRLATVMDHIRMFARPDWQAPSAFEVSELIADTLTLAASRVDAVGLKVISDIAPGLPSLRVPRVPLEQVLMNIILNACDAYEEPAQSKIPLADRILLIVVRLSDDWMIFSIGDRAGGIPQRILDQIFDPFFTTKPPGKGSGIGLSVSHGAITDMGGTLSAHNAYGGAVFEVRLPIPRQEPHAK